MYQQQLLFSKDSISVHFLTSGCDSLGTPGNGRASIPTLHSLGESCKIEYLQCLDDIKYLKTMMKDSKSFIVNVGF